MIASKDARSFYRDVETRGKEDVEQKKKKKDALADIYVCTMQNEEARIKFWSETGAGKINKHNNYVSET